MHRSRPNCPLSLLCSLPLQFSGPSRTAHEMHPAIPVHHLVDNYYVRKAIHGVALLHLERQPLMGTLPHVQEIAAVRRKDAAAGEVAAQQAREVQLQQRYKDLCASRSEVRATSAVAAQAAEAAP